MRWPSVYTYRQAVRWLGAASLRKLPAGYVMESSLPALPGNGWVRIYHKDATVTALVYFEDGGILVDFDNDKDIEVINRFQRRVTVQRADRTNYQRPPLVAYPSVRIEPRDCSFTPLAKPRGRKAVEDWRKYNILIEHSAGVRYSNRPCWLVRKNRRVKHMSMWEEYLKAEGLIERVRAETKRLRLERRRTKRRQERNVRTFWEAFTRNEQVPH